MRKFLQALMLGSALVMPTLTAHAVEDYKGVFPTKTLYILCSNKEPTIRAACNFYLQGLMYGLRAQVAMRNAGMTVCLPDEMTTEAARLNMLSFINTVTNGNPSENRDGGDWVAWMSLEAGHLCSQQQSQQQ